MRRSARCTSVSRRSSRQWRSKCPMSSKQGGQLRPWRPRFPCGDVRLGLTSACRRPLPASARASLRLPGAPDAQRWAAQPASHINLTPYGLTMNNELRSNLRESFNRKAQDRDRAIMQAWKVEERLSFLLLLQQHTRTLLELGAGTGKDGKLFQDHGLEV